MSSQAKLIEKLKKELSTLGASPKKIKLYQNLDKENIGSPNRSFNVSLAESPGPLKERNA